MGYFYPDYADSTGLTTSSTTVVYSGHDVFIRDVHTFIDRLKDAAAFRGEDLVKNRIPALLQGAA